MNLKFGYGTFQAYQQLLVRANKLGLTFNKAKWTHEDDIGLYPLDDNLPIYTRDAMIGAGDLSTIQAFIAGVEWARDYDAIMKVSSEKTRAKREHDYRKTRMFKQLKDEKYNEIQN